MPPEFQEPPAGRSSDDDPYRGAERYCGDGRDISGATGRSLQPALGDWAAPLGYGDPWYVRDGPVYERDAAADRCDDHPCGGRSLA